MAARFGGECGYKRRHSILCGIGAFLNVDCHGRYMNLIMVSHCIELKIHTSKKKGKEYWGNLNISRGWFICQYPLSVIVL